MSATLSARRSTRMTRDELRTLATPAPTSTWKPVSHWELVDSLHSEIERREINVTSEQYAVQKEGNILFGTMDLDWRDDGESTASIGLRTANDKSMSIQLAIGMRIFVCDNMMFAGDLIALKRKHTKHLNLAQEISGGLDRYQQGFHRLKDDVNCWKNTPIEDGRAKHLIFDIFRKKIVPMRLFHPVVNDWQQATRDVPSVSLWDINNCFTNHMKSLRPAPQFRSHIKLGKFFSALA